MPCYLNALGIVNALGDSKERVLAALLAGSQANLRPWSGNPSTWVAQVKAPLPALDSLPLRYRSRNNQLALQAATQIAADIHAARERYGAARVAVVLGTSTSGIAEGEQAFARHLEVGERPSHYVYAQQEIGTLAEFIAASFDLQGPAYTLSTACSSSAHALASAKRLLDADLADAVITGGSDSLCELTVKGFAALESVSSAICNPFSVNRSGINIGEGAALFLASRERGPQAIELLSVGASSDAYHISAPHPEGHGARRAIEMALAAAQLESADVGYVNLHGTATPLNDSMESKVVNALFGAALPCSSSKAQIGHTLGAAAANEAALCWLCLSDLNPTQALPPHLWDGQADPALPPLALVSRGQSVSAQRPIYLSNSFAFGGNNAAVLLGRSQ